MNFQQLNYVVEISKCGSINKAANKLFLSQSGISTAIRELEEELGIQFFVRSNRGVEFTPDGREFLGYAASLLEPLRPRICPSPPSAIPLRRMPSSSCSNPRRPTAISFPSGRWTWTPLSTTCMTTGRISGSSA